MLIILNIERCDVDICEALGIEEDASAISWAEHSMIVRNTYMDGLSNGRRDIVRLIEREQKKTESVDLKKVLDHIALDEIERNSIIVMRPGPNWIQGLVDLCKVLGKGCKLVEIGCYAGESTKVFSEHLDLVIAIDPWRAVEGEEVTEDTHNYTYKLDIAEKVFDRVRRNSNNIIKLKGFDDEFLEVIPDKSMDAVYIDGNHYEEPFKKNLKAWLSKVKDDGYICGHDYYDITPGVVKAVEEVLGKPHMTFSDSSWLFEMKKLNL